MTDMDPIAFVKIRLAAEEIARSSHAAYWDERRLDFHAGNIRPELERIAGLMGLTLTPIETPEQKDAA